MGNHRPEGPPFPPPTETTVLPPKVGAANFRGLPCPQYQGLQTPQSCPMASATPLDLSTPISKLPQVQGRPHPGTLMSNIRGFCFLWSP